jgi:hypothetical protein
MVDKTGIHVFVNQDWTTTNAVFSDVYGLYIVDGKGGWTCGRCNYYNTEGFWVCGNCNGPR